MFNYGYLRKLGFLSFPNKDGKFILYTDAPEFAFASVLCPNQIQEEKLSFMPPGSYPIQRKDMEWTKTEMLDVVCFVRHFKHYIWRVHFQIKCDHQALVPMLTMLQMESGIEPM